MPSDPSPPLRFRLSPRLQAHSRTEGREGEPVLIVDAALANPDALVDAAAETPFAPAWGPAGGYPGLRAPAPLDYVSGVCRALLPAIVEAFGLPPSRPRRAECSFSLVTRPPDTLHPSQQAPHVDTTDPWQFAILHYLCDPGFGGTGFYRHRATGFELLTPDRLAGYDAARAAEPAGSGYIAADDAAFDWIGGVDAAWNRIAVYRSRRLHSGHIAAPERLSDDPRRGRLTTNIFLTLAPQK